MTAKALAHLRFPVTSSLGRRYPEPPHPYRNEFQRDRDRIIHARAFRRLEDKTQVFASGVVDDHLRNRLTHTLEVAQIARTVASVLGLDEELTEVLALSHDIGHPPFAHAGEEELNRVMRQYGDRFDHNLHSLRIVEKFEQRYARFPGLNLTFEVREGIAKHSRDFELGEFPELDEYLPGLRPPLEAQIIDLADEIAYNTADLDDGFASGMFDLDDLSANVPVLGQLIEAVQTMYAGAPPRLQFFESQRGLIDHLVTGLIQGIWLNTEASGVPDVDAVRRHPGRLAAFDKESAETNRKLKAFLADRLYSSPQLVEERQQGVRMISELFDALVSDPSQLPPWWEETEEPVHRRVCDYIAGMTDGYCRRVYSQVVLQSSSSEGSLPWVT
ncbi:MAG TPA: dNTP triphosphohydrolase [Bryobacteraceae bacterium]|nr:dNTP triphosphohydrolase [Bryobacteraceae bacterium]